MSTRALSIALGMVLMAAAPTVAAPADEHGGLAPRVDLHQVVNRGEPDDVQAPRGEPGDPQAPRGEPDEVQAPRGSLVTPPQA
jgi:hypothetical protein